MYILVLKLVAVPVPVLVLHVHPSNGPTIALGFNQIQNQLSNLLHCCFNNKVGGQKGNR